MEATIPRNGRQLLRSHPRPVAPARLLSIDPSTYHARAAQRLVLSSSCPSHFVDQVMLDAVQLARSHGIGRDANPNEQTHKCAANFKSLSPREREVMAFVTKGLMNKQIAAEMGLARSR
jgi:DNA-binding NarL/FixJ family response regulator